LFCLPQDGTAVFQLPLLRHVTLFVCDKLYPVSHMYTAEVVYPSQCNVMLIPSPASRFEHLSE
jgi:hypothetical protein